MQNQTDYSQGRPAIIVSAPYSVALISREYSAAVATAGMQQQSAPAHVVLS